MSTPIAASSPHVSARIAGGMYLLWGAFAGFTLQYIPRLIVPEDAAVTINHLLASESLVRLSIMSDFIGQIGYIIVALLLYRLFKSVNNAMAWLMVIFWLVEVPIDMLNQANLLAVLFLIHTPGGLAADQVHALVSLLLNLHTNGINIAELFYGLWLLPMGYLVFRSGFLPKLIGVLLFIACLGYVAQSVIDIIFPTSGVIIYLFTSWGELVFAAWLLIRGINVAQWAKRALVSDVNIPIPTESIR